MTAIAKLHPELAATPPMGWNSWNCFGCNINERMLWEMADALVDSGMKDAGYEYLVIDDAWMAMRRDDDGNLMPDPDRFPRGIKAFADHVHGKGLKLGIYEDAGEETCGHYPGSLGHYQQDAMLFASWGVDYLKFDWCTCEKLNAPRLYGEMREALLGIERPMVFSICEWGQNRPWEWAPAIGHLWRTTWDITDKWDFVGDGEGKWGGLGIVNILDQQIGLKRYAGPGRWNDPDMLEVGNGGMTETEYRSHFSLWCILAAPLIAGNDLRKMDAASRQILTNREVIAVDQDSAGIQGRRVKKEGDQEIWAKPLHDGGVAVVLFNRGQSPANIVCDWRAIGLGTGTAEVRDLWAGRDLGCVAEGYIGRVPVHGVMMLKVSSI